MTGAVNAMLGGGPQISASGQTISDTGIGGADAGANYQARNDGSVWALRTSGVDEELEKWLRPHELAPGEYEINVTSTGAALTAGSSATGTDLALTSSRFWGIERTSNGSSSATLTVRYKLNGAILKTVTVTLNADKEP